MSALGDLTVVLLSELPLAMLLGEINCFIASFS
jgi:hypothetical protein